MLVALTAARRPPPPSVPPVAVATPAPPTIKSGVEKWRAGDYPAAVAIWTPFATAGDADALFNLGQAYKLGRGVAVDPVAARDYYRKAATKGHLPAQANLGIALFQAGEKVEAIKWLKTAADRGEARAQYVLGIATFNGDSVARSQSLGYAY
ncbi:MAG: sel1 repeat family protein, partial [Sphingomonadaceae bacterium]|nr:sel1 repeat family protein [Sphingomonadaceae bacterium]